MQKQTPISLRMHNLFIIWSKHMLNTVLKKPLLWTRWAVWFIRQETQTFFVPTVSASLPWGEKGMVGQHWYHYSLISGVQENLHIWVVNVHSIPFNTGKLLFMYPKNIQIIQWQSSLRYSVISWPHGFRSGQHSAWPRRSSKRPALEASTALKMGPSMPPGEVQDLGWYPWHKWLEL